MCVICFLLSGASLKIDRQRQIEKSNGKWLVVWGNGRIEGDEGGAR
jgi:hypothetical protein